MEYKYNQPENETQGFTDDLIFRLLISETTLLYSIQTLALLASMAKLSMSPWVARLILILALAAAALPFLMTRFQTKIFPAIKRGSIRFPIWGFITISLGIYIILWAAAYHMPDLSYDGNSYHIPTIAMWDQTGYVHWVKTVYLETIINGYPKGAELVAYVLVKALNNQVINTVNLVFLPLGVLGIMRLSRRLGARVPLAICAGLAFILVPTNIGQSPTTYVDSAFASSAIGFLALMFSFIPPQKPNVKHVIAFGASMGLMVSVKSTGLGVAAFGVSALLFPWVISVLHTKQGVRKSVFIILVAFLIIAATALAGGYWYIRNYLITGSPLYPIGINLLGTNLFPGASVSETIFSSQNTPEKIKGWPVILQTLYTWAQSPGEWPVSILGYDSGLGGLGFLWIAGCVPAIILHVIFLLKSKQKTQWEFVLLFTVVTATFLTTPLQWWARYTLWIYALGLPCFVAALGRIIVGEINFLNKVGKVWAILCTGILIVEASYATINVIALASPQSLRSNLAHILDKHTWEWPKAYLFEDMQDTVLEGILSGNDTVALGPHGDNDFWHYAGLVGQLSQPIGERRLLLLTEDDVRGQLQSEVVRYVLWDETVPVPEELEALAVQMEHVDQFIVITLE